MEIKTLFLAAFCFLLTTSIFGQNQEKYAQLIEEASSLFESKDYLLSAEKYKAAFEQFEEQINTRDIYNAACAYALANDPKSSFDLLFHLANEAQYKNYWHIATDLDLKKLHNQEGWSELMEIIRHNKNEAEGIQRNEISDLLDEIMLKDQGGRREYRAIIAVHGYEATETERVRRQVWLSDSLNVIKVTNLLDSLGWPSLKQIGKPGSNAIFLTLQHGDMKTQEEYLPVLRKAVADGKIAAGALALLEDRLSLRQGKRQVYGTQIARDPETGENYVSPLMEPEKVNERRVNVGLKPIEEYLVKYGIDWDTEKHKAQIKKIESNDKN
ncbi:hypothetical protein G3567_10805 [Psychroflexus sp. YR1-1]|uniref:Uncharacterized protein n=1 Tax=Psychroflexus aurantiacus TaxID=2709310 RepID=A0A6B3R217_9FLAO|nr:DUF6624 domain-containing protein [Psychroflexus aurantiacus]NEV94633.1 hypothetical protein [Psychroflexus aurantiacus]